MRLFLLVVAAFSALAGPIRVDVAQEKAGSEPAHFIPVVGNWLVVPEGGKNVLMVDGRQWKKGQPAGGLAEKARLIYGSRHEEFIDNVKAFAYFPYAVARGVEDARRGEIDMTFQGVGGQ